MEPVQEANAQTRVQLLNKHHLEIFQHPTTSFREFCTTKDTMWAHKWVVFARKPIPTGEGIQALFTMPEVQNGK